MRLKMLFVGGLLIAVAGCASTDSTFGTVSGGEVNVFLLDEANGSVSNDAGLVAFVTGTSISGGTYWALSGIQAGYEVGVPIVTGEVEYDATYAYYVIDNIQYNSGYAEGDGVGENGSITLTADFDNHSLVGSDAALVVNGTISGGQIGGTVIAFYSDPDASGAIQGELAGYIGDEGLIAAFHGNDPNTVLAGGVTSDCGC